MSVLRWFRSGTRGLAIAALVLPVSACMVGPDFERPEAPILDSWRRGAGLEIDPATGFTTRSEAVANWWTLFGDPTLNRLVLDAYRENLTLQAAGVRVYQARAQLGIATGELFPQQQQIAGSYKHQTFSINEPVFQRIHRFIPFNRHIERTEVGFDAAWEIDFWGKIRRGIQSANSNLSAKIASYDDALVTLTGDVAATYVTIRELQGLIAISRENAALQKQSLDIAKLRIQNGAATELDLDEAIVLYNNTLADIPKYQAQLAQAENAMSILLSEPPGDIHQRIGDNPRLPRVPAEVAIGVPADLLRRRPDIRAAEYEAAAQSAQIGVAEADLYPAFYISGGIGVEAGNFHDLFSTGSMIKLINPGFTWNFLNYGRILNNVRVQDATFQQLLLNYKNTVLSAYAEVENALIAFLKSKEEALYLSRSVDAARRASKIVIEQYRGGTADYDRVVDSLKNLLTAQERLLATRADELTNLIAVYKGLGGGWLPANVDGFISPEVAEQMQYRTNWGGLLYSVPAQDELAAN